MRTALCKFATCDVIVSVSTYQDINNENAPMDQHLFTSLNRHSFGPPHQGEVRRNARNPYHQGQYADKY